MAGNMLTEEQWVSHSTVGLTADGLNYAPTKLFASGQNIIGPLDNLMRLQTLTHVDLSRNMLGSLVGLESLPCLATLIASDNLLTEVLDFFAPSTGSRLRTADLCRNKITGSLVELDHDGSEVLRGGMAAHPLVQSLLLEGNRITSVRGFDVLEELTCLSLRENDLRDESDSETPLILPSGLTSLDLSHNRGIIALPMDLLASLSALRSLCIEGCALDVDIGGGVHASSVVVWGREEVEPRVQQAVRWHVARCLPRLERLNGVLITSHERANAAALEARCFHHDAVADEVLRRRRRMRDENSSALDSRTGKTDDGDAGNSNSLDLRCGPRVSFG